MTLAAIGIASFLFVVWFTLRSYYAGANPRLAIIEAWVNIFIGFAVNFVANIFVLPLVGASFTAADNFFLGWTYTAISILRQYAVRRWCQENLHEFLMKIFEKGSVK